MIGARHSEGAGRAEGCNRAQQALLDGLEMTEPQGGSDSSSEVVVHWKENETSHLLTRISGV